jgi:hypothetical protein
VGKISIILDKKYSHRHPSVLCDLTMN